MTSKNANLNATLGSTLDSLPGGSSVAVLDFLGSLCPITTGHIQCLELARAALTGEVRPLNVPGEGSQLQFGEVLATINVNGDFHVRSKLKSKGEASLSCAERQHLCELATADVPWIRADGCSSDKWIKHLHKKHPHLSFIRYYVNGADDVVKYRKWQQCGPDKRFVTIGRPGDTQKVLEAVLESKVPHEYFVLTPEHSDISSSAAREALQTGAREAAASMLHRDVLTWLQEHGPYQPRGARTAAEPRSPAVVKVTEGKP